MNAGRVARALAYVVVAAAAVAWVRSLPAPLAGTADGDDPYRYVGGDGRQYVYLGGHDGYAWAIAARKLQQHGSVCDEVVDGVCRDLTSLAPVGRAVRYPHSLHVRAIAAMHDLMTAWRPGTPLLAAPAAVSTVVVALATLPAFALGYRLAGWLGGLLVPLLAGLNPLLLGRTLDGDNDAWNYLFPMLSAWLVAEAVLARRRAAALGVAALAGLLIGPYATIWNGWPFAWSMALAGLTANAFLLAASRLRAAPDHAAGDVATSLGMVAAFVVAAGVATALAGASPSYLDALPSLLDSRLLSAPAAAAAGPALAWPDAYDDVRELRGLELGEVAVWLGGRLALFFGWLGMLLMLMPRRGWRGPHFAVFVGGVLLYRVLLSPGGAAVSLSRLQLVALLAAPILAAVALYAFDPRDGARRRASIAIVAWGLAALYLGFGSARHLLLAVPPFAVATAVAADRVRGWLLARVAAPRAAAALGTASAVALALVAVQGPATTVRAMARRHVPQVNDAWHAALTQVRDRAPSDAIVSTWWPFGYWAGYFAERRVSVDGGTLYSAGPYWLARAMLSPDERESAGMLRLLHCGGGADRPQASPILARLTAAGLSSAAALAAVDEVVRLDRTAARRALENRAVPAAAAAAVLAVTHCAPPPSYLVLSDLDGRDRSWQRLAGWSFARGFAASAAPQRAAESVAADLVAIFALEPDAARRLADAAAEAASRGGLRDFAVESRPVPVSPWGACRGEGPILECGVRGADTVRAVELRPDAPAATRLLGGAVPPLTHLIVAGDAGLEEHRVAEGDGWAVLFDAVERRAAVGSRAALRSTWARLMMLDGRYDRLFEKVGEGSAAGERVAAWRVDWDAWEEPHD